MLARRSCKTRPEPLNGALFADCARPSGTTLKEALGGRPRPCRAPGLASVKRGWASSRAQILRAGNPLRSERSRRGPSLCLSSIKRRGASSRVQILRAVSRFRSERSRRGHPAGLANVPRAWVSVSPHTSREASGVLTVSLDTLEDSYSSETAGPNQRLLPTQPRYARPGGRPASRSAELLVFGNSDDER